MSRVVHVITGLETGGAEILLVRVLEQLAERDGGLEGAEVISLTGRGALAERVEALGVGVTALEMSPATMPARLPRLRGALARARPDAVQTWLLHANVIGGVAARLARHLPVAWGVHITDVDPAIYGRAAAAMQRAERALARWIPGAIIACSESSAAAMARLGYPEPKVLTIPNGFDTAVLHPDRAEGLAVREELGIAPDRLVAGHLARFHPMKDQANLLRAARRVAERVPQATFVLCGRGLDANNPELARLAEPLGDRVVMLGERSDAGRILRCFDVMALSSAAGEALPLVVGEAMATAVPVVATDCGDSPYIVGDTGRIVPVRDAPALAHAICELLELPAGRRAELGAAARLRIEKRYSLTGMVDGYARVWERLAASNSS